MKEIVDSIYAIENINPTQDCILYIIDTKSNEGLVLIDPGLYFKYDQEFGEKGFSVRDINHCLITHEHLDHYGACFELEKLNRTIKFYAHELGVNKIEQK
ncbi:MAG: MBL fold metallo-hydrolase, partial [Candidatus Lokiarchaeota archaeon]|nr:MBL fold metallo-hydrolase [Candidatus Lokiarchaeota archaeon]